MSTYLSQWLGRHMFSKIIKYLEISSNRKNTEHSKAKTKTKISKKYSNRIM